jgi:hypothetical protein
LSAWAASIGDRARCTLRHRGNQLSGSTLALFARSLAELAGRPVIDRTGLEGTGR